MEVKSRGNCEFRSLNGLIKRYDVDEIMFETGTSSWMTMVFITTLC